MGEPSPVPQGKAMEAVQNPEPTVRNFPGVGGMEDVKYCESAMPRLVMGQADNRRLGR